MTRQLVIYLESKNNENDKNEENNINSDEAILTEVLKMIKEGYTSGYKPFWTLIDNEN